MQPANETLIYVRVAGKQPECWAPAWGVLVSANVYRVTSVVGKEALEFKVGDLVRCEFRCFPDGSEATVAVAPGGPA